MEIKTIVSWSEKKGIGKEIVPEAAAGEDSGA